MDFLFNIILKRTDCTYAMYSFVLTDYERTLAETRRRAFLLTSSEDEFTQIVFERMLERPDLEAMLDRIDTELKGFYGIHPHQVARYGGVQCALDILRPNHPDMAQFHMHYIYYMDALLIRERAWKRLRRIVALKRFAMRVSRSFCEHYYAPPWGRGARRALWRLKQGFKVRVEE